MAEIPAREVRAADPRPLLRALLAIANLLLIPLLLWMATHARGPGAWKPFVLGSVSAVVATYALFARINPRLRALLLVPSAIEWLGVVVVGLMATFLGPMDGVHGVSWIFLGITALPFSIFVATMIAMVSSFRARPTR
jgi:hypothetical protein